MWQLKVVVLTWQLAQHLSWQRKKYFKVNPLKVTTARSKQKRYISSSVYTDLKHESFNQTCSYFVHFKRLFYKQVFMYFMCTKTLALKIFS